MAVHILARARTLFARRPILYWILIALLAAWTADIAVGKVAAVDAARRRWGESVDAWVATEDLAPGDPVVAVRRLLPAAVVPDAAVVDDPGGATALQHVGTGEILTRADLGDEAFDLLPVGWQGVAFAADDTTIPVRIGDHVAVVADGEVIVDVGVVLDVAPRAVTVAVPAADVPVAALAARMQAAALAIRRP